LATPSEQAEQDALLEWLKSSSHKQQAQRDDEVGIPVGVGVRGGSIDCAAATPPAGAPSAARGAQVDGRAFAADFLDIVVPSRIAPSIMTATSGLSRTGSRRAGRPARRRAGSQRAACRRRKRADRGPARSVGAHAGEGDHRHPDGLLRLRTSHPHRVWAAAGLPTWGVAALVSERIGRCWFAPGGVRFRRRGGDPRRGGELPAWPRLGRMALAARGFVSGHRWPWGEPWPPAWTAVSRRVSSRWQ